MRTRFRRLGIIFTTGLLLLFLTACGSTKPEQEAKLITTLPSLAELEPLETRAAFDLDKFKQDTEPEKSDQEEAKGQMVEIVASSWPMPQLDILVNGPAVKGLDSLVRAYLKERNLADAEISIVYENLVTKQRYSYRGDETYQAASTIKVPIAMVVYQMIHEGAFPADLAIPYEIGEHFIGDGFKLAEEGELVPIRLLIEHAIRYSGNTETSAIFKYFYDHGQYLHSVMDRRLGTNYGEATELSAVDAIRCLEELYFNQQKVEGYRELIQFMGTTTWNQFYTAHLTDRQIIHKYGVNGAFMHDMGIVYGVEPYAFAVYTASGTGYQTLPELGWIIDQWHQMGKVDLSQIPITYLPEYQPQVNDQTQEGGQAVVDDQLPDQAGELSDQVDPDQEEESINQP